MKHLSKTWAWSMPLLLVLSALGCRSTISTSTTGFQSMSQLEQHLNTLLLQLSSLSKSQQTLTKISHCRYEISTRWESASSGYYRANKVQRFSFSHDLRAVDHTPAHSLNFDSGVQSWSEKIELIFNRPLPSLFKYIDRKTFAAKQRQSTNDQYSLIGFNHAPLKLMTDIQAAFKHMATLCDNDLDKLADINHKVLGRWDLYGHANSLGLLTIAPNAAILQYQQDQPITGPYIIEAQDDHYRLIINPTDNRQRFVIAFTFVNSLYARLLLLGNSSSASAFVPLADSHLSAKNPDEIKLFRLGDLL